MIEVILTLTPISLIDSLSLLPFAVVVLAVLLSGPKPYVAATSFLLGIFLSYFAAGVVIAWGLGAVIDRVTAALVHWFKNPSATDYILSMVIGVALIALGYRWANARRVKAEQKKASPGMTPAQAFGVGAGATIAGVWGALPYFAAIDQILKANLSYGESAIALAYYNVVFVSLGAVLIPVKAFLGPRADAMFETVNRLIAVWGKRVLIAAMLVLGAVMVADGVGWMLGRPIIPVG